MIICADDYGLSDDIDQAILELCSSQRLSAVSCMVALERCDAALLAKLRRHENVVDVGLHLVFADETLSRPAGALAESSPPYFPAYGPHLRRTLTGRVSAMEAFQQVSSQYELFLKKCGRNPDFIDGHLHTHQLSGVRQGLINFVLTLPAGQRPYVRNTHGPLRQVRRARLPLLKAAFIGAFGQRMRAQLQTAGLRTNEGFTGIYDFGDWRRYRELFPRFVAALPNPNGMLVVHPGGREDWRRQEFNTLREFPFAPGSPNRFQLSARR